MPTWRVITTPSKLLRSFEVAVKSGSQRKGFHHLDGGRIAQGEVLALPDVQPSSSQSSVSESWKPSSDIAPSKTIALRPARNFKVPCMIPESSTRQCGGYPYLPGRHHLTCRPINPLTHEFPHSWKPRPAIAYSHLRGGSLFCWYSFLARPRLSRTKMDRSVGKAAWAIGNPPPPISSHALHISYLNLGSFIAAISFTISAKDISHI